MPETLDLMTFGFGLRPSSPSALPLSFKPWLRYLHERGVGPQGASRVSAMGVMTQTRSALLTYFAGMFSVSAARRRA
jgi:hypothetical protein